LKNIKFGKVIYIVQ